MVERSKSPDWGIPLGVRVLRFFYESYQCYR
ncbi:hypothetical protein DH86_00000071 [Scytalidium sp. 3C]|nr:hypothetical protein DH86_00000071 [Scytalidium sp. 3C]